MGEESSNHVSIEGNSESAELVNFFKSRFAAFWPCLLGEIGH